MRNDDSSFRGLDPKLVFNAQKFHIDDSEDLKLYHMVMRKYAGDSVLCSEKYFNKSADLYVYVEWLGEKDFIEEFVHPSTQAALAAQNPTATAKSLKSIAGKILHAANAKDNGNAPS